MNTKQWIKRNNFEDNQDYVIKVLHHFNLSNYHFALFDGELGLLLEQGLKKYKITLDNQKCVMNIYRCNMGLSTRKYTKEKMVLKQSFKEDCIWNSIKWIAKDSKIGDCT